MAVCGIHAQYRVSVMNTTKWEEVKHLLRTFKLPYRAKLMTGPAVSYWSGAGLAEPTNVLDHHGPVLTLHIEWLVVMHNMKFLAVCWSDSLS